MVMVRVSTSVSAPPVPVLPPSFVVMVSVTAPDVLAAGVNTGAEPEARYALMLASVPVSVSEPVPDPPTVTEPPAVAAIVPALTASVTVIEPAAASTSATDKPVRASATSSLVA